MTQFSTLRSLEFVELQLRWMRTAHSSSTRSKTEGDRAADAEIVLAIALSVWDLRMDPVGLEHVPSVSQVFRNVSGSSVTK